MDQTLLMVFTGILAIAVLLQSFLFFLMYRSIHKMSIWMDSTGRDLLRNIEAVSAKVEEGLTTIKSMADGLKPIKEKLAESTDIVHRRITELDIFLADATKTAQLEILRVQDTIHTATRRAQETMDLLHDSILAPLSEISAISRAVRVGLDVLFRRRKNISATQDEEMFI